MQGPQSWSRAKLTVLARSHPASASVACDHRVLFILLEPRSCFGGRQGCCVIGDAEPH